MGCTRVDPAAAPMSWGPALDLVTVAAASRKRMTYTRDELLLATQLVHAVWAAGRELGVEPRDWAAVASLGHECLDAVRQSTMRRAAAGA